MKKKFLIVFCSLLTIVYSANFTTINAKKSNENNLISIKNKAKSQENKTFFQSLDLSKLRFNNKKHNLNLWDYKLIKQNDFLINYSNIINNKPSTFSIQQDTFIDISQCLDNYFGNLENYYYNSQNIFANQAWGTFFNYNLFFYILKKDPNSNETLNDPVNSFKWVRFMKNNVYDDYYIRLTNVENSNWKINNSYIDFTINLSTLPKGNVTLNTNDLNSIYYNGKAPKDWKFTSKKNDTKNNFFLLYKIYTLHFLDISTCLTNDYYLSYFIKNALFNFSFTTTISYPLSLSLNKNNGSSKTKSVTNYLLSAENIATFDKTDDNSIKDYIRKIDNLNTINNALISLRINISLLNILSWIQFSLFVNCWVSKNDYSLNIAFGLEATDSLISTIKYVHNFNANNSYERLVNLIFKPITLSYNFANSNY